ncbi:MAG: GNAT family N-acetyltransferase [Dehalococcoidia bacterium]|nr:GNAT family N-acetyltransferase [Dehalococcoidia bacterium]
MGIAPLRRRGGTICFIGNVEVSDYLDFVLQGREEETFYKAFLDALENENWETMDLHCLPAGSPTLTYLPPQARSRGLSVALEKEEVCPGINLPGTWEEFVASLNKKYRHELRRKMRRLMDSDSFRYYSLEGEALAEGVDDFLRLHRVSSDEKAAFMDSQMEVFFRTMVPQMAAKNWAKLYFLEVDGRRVSTVLCFQHGQEILLYNSGFDPAYGWLSVGLLLKAFCIRDAIEAGKKRFDFLRGDERYKYELGGVDVPIYRCLVQKV